ncbi:uncharacterized protein AMSG_03647 [Thecamonas trahens ATCC 50062]|uniref:GATA-type domain-containing protein n=1 Tax=Thecamonas trahens ATCC 50062 TaxID=461836 RepID=A0A0L0D4H8_THETB|nr:hypothetical protein AMSG_03647 [Thecamonas trahens ATCC 50062]KNC47219.1 hypothetical protein AMSG_03647 [Thecamonas trahens ATCC 50062]|eukprot:XP_013759988.1 hypothetical protein AMSG_03647 [Thecamonas trahens ATCC 50062]
MLCSSCHATHSYSWRITSASAVVCYTCSLAHPPESLRALSHKAASRALESAGLAPPHHSSSATPHSQPPSDMPLKAADPAFASAAHAESRTPLATAYANYARSHTTAAGRAVSAALASVWGGELDAGRATLSYADLARSIQAEYVAAVARGADAAATGSSPVAEAKPSRKRTLDDVLAAGPPTAASAGRATKRRRSRKATKPLPMFVRLKRAFLAGLHSGVYSELLRAQEATTARTLRKVENELRSFSPATGFGGSDPHSPAPFTPPSRPVASRSPHSSSPSPWLLRSQQPPQAMPVPSLPASLLMLPTRPVLPPAKPIHPVARTAAALPSSPHRHVGLLPLATELHIARPRWTRARPRPSAPLTIDDGLLAHLWLLHYQSQSAK